MSLVKGDAVEVRHGTDSTIGLRDCPLDHVCATLYIQMIRFYWDENKNQSNLLKHGVDFETAKLIFDDPCCVTFIESTTGGESRWHGIGSLEETVILVVVHTYRTENADEEIRIISARQATRHERKLYAKANR